MLNRLTATSTVPAAIAPPEDEHGLDLREAIGFLWRQWIFIASVVGAVLFVTAVYVYSETPRYTATAQVLLEMQQEMAAKEDPILSQIRLDPEAIESELAIIKSDVFLRRVVEKLGLVSDPEFGSAPPQAAPAPSLFGRIRSAFGGSSVASASSAPESASSAPENDPDSSRVTSSVQRLKGAITAATSGSGVRDWHFGNVG